MFNNGNTSKSIPGIDNGSATDTGITIDSNNNTTLGGSGISNPGYELMVQSSGTVSYLNRTGSDGVVMLFGNDGVNAGHIDVSGATVSYNTTSDYRLKENVVPMTKAIDRLNRLNPSRFNFITNPDNTVDGFIAHEAQEIVPEAVTGEKDGAEIQGIDQSKLVPLLVGALQEAIARIETLENA